jgi:hypothetical protein
MAPHAIVSYDASPVDRDALALAGLLRDAGARLTLAYVRHRTETRADHELIADVGAEGRLREGAQRLGDPELDLRVVTNPSTARGLGDLVVGLGADAVVFGSEHRTPHGRIGVGRVAAALMENGPAAVALAPAGFAATAPAPDGLRRIGVLPGAADEAAIETAYSLAARHDATVLRAGHGVDLLVVGSRPQAAEGRVLVSASAADAIEQTCAPVLVPARGAALDFESLVAI